MDAVLLSCHCDKIPKTNKLKRRNVHFSRRATVCWLLVPWWWRDGWRKALVTCWLKPRGSVREIGYYSNTASSDGVIHCQRQNVQCSVLVRPLPRPQLRILLHWELSWASVSLWGHALAPNGSKFTLLSSCAFMLYCCMRCPLSYAFQEHHSARWIWWILLCTIICKCSYRNYGLKLLSLSKIKGEN